MSNYIDITYPGLHITKRTPYSKLKIDSIFNNEYKTIMEKDIEKQYSEEFQKNYTYENDNIITDINVEEINNAEIGYLFLPEAKSIKLDNYFSNLLIFGAYIPEKMKSFGIIFKRSNIEQLYIPSNIIDIESFAFKSCSNLRTLIIDAQIDTISLEMCYCCKNLNFVKLPDTITEIKGSAFRGCYNLTKIDLPDSLRFISERAFENTGLKEIKLPKNLIYIGENAFAETEIISITIPSKTIKIDKNAFAFSKLESITFEDINLKLEENIFKHTRLKEINIISYNLEETKKFIETNKEQFKGVKINIINKSIDDIIKEEKNEEKAIKSEEILR